MSSIGKFPIMKSAQSLPKAMPMTAPPTALTVGHGLVAIATAFNKAREEVGLPGALLLGYLVVFWAFGTKAQQAEFTDKVLLLHGLPDSRAYA